jgi:hypothetical protein
VSEACGINPQVLIVLLQKEQSLVTDDWPWTTQYRSATGYGCPDTAPCDSEFYGFFNQVYSAARQFKRYVRDANLFSYRAGLSSYIQYNPNTLCGGSNIFISNSATAALYNYTPYQPNAASLNNLYGTGDSCSAYGNRNFWRLFNDWFGSTLYTPPTPAPKASITANDSEAVTVDYASDVTISWQSSNATNCVVQPMNITILNGQQTIHKLTKTTTYSIACTGTSGSANDQVILTDSPT